MAARTFDCVVVGAGPGGYVAAIRAAQLGMATAVVERGAVGGRCLNVACIPAKAVLRAADLLSEVREAGEFGIVVAEPTVDFAAVMARREKVVSTLTGGVSGLFKKNKIELIAGEATLTAAGTLMVGDDELSAKAIVLATGSVPRAVPGIDFGGRIVGTEEAWAFAELPGRLAVLGAGPSGSEIASAYARLGSETHLFEVLDRVLPTEDEDISKIVGRGLTRQGVKVHTATAIENAQSGEKSVTFTAAGEQIEVDWLVLAVGRGPDVAGLGLEAAGV
jgi:dihydrolipoamide dehydrogenase